MLLLVIVLVLSWPALAADPDPHAELRDLVENGHFKRARAVVERQASAYSGDPRFLALAAQVKLAFDDLDTAAKFAEQAAELEPRNPDRQFLLCEIYGTQAQRASLLRQPFLGRKTKKAMDAAIALDPRHVDSLFVLMLYYQMAPGLIGGDKAKAHEMPSRIRAIDPARGWLAEARLAELEKRPDAMEQFYRKAVEANPRHFQARMALATLLFHQKKDYVEAAAHAKAAQDVAPTRARPYAILAGAAAALQQKDRLEYWLQAAERAIPDNLYPHLVAARILGESGRDANRAKALAGRYLELEPEATFPSHAQVRGQIAKFEGGAVKARSGR